MHICIKTGHPGKQPFLELLSTHWLQAERRALTDSTQMRLYVKGSSVCVGYWAKRVTLCSLMDHWWWVINSSHNAPGPCAPQLNVAPWDGTLAHPFTLGQGIHTSRGWGGDGFSYIARLCRPSCYTPSYSPYTLLATTVATLAGFTWSPIWQGVSSACHFINKSRKINTKPSIWYL